MSVLPGEPIQTDGADSVSVVPRYIEIRLALSDRIISGDWPPGHRVPSEHELMGQYGCSRMTVNKALSALAASGLIIRKRRSGTFVANPQSQHPVLEIQDIRAEVTENGQAYAYQILSRRIRKATSLDIEHLGVPPGTRVLALSVLHCTSGVPFVLEDRIISLVSIPEAEAESFADAPPGTWLLAQIPWTHAEHVIRAVGADAEAAVTLSIAMGTACLVIERKTWRGNTPLTWVRLCYPGGRHQLLARFTPGRDARPDTGLAADTVGFA